MMRLLHPDASKTLFLELFRQPEIRTRLKKLKAHHNESYWHSARVGLLNIDVGIAFELPKTELIVLGCGGMMHDIGKLEVPTNILSKKGTLSEQDWSTIENHPNLGFAILEDAYFKDIRDIVVAHHACKPHPYPQGIRERFGNTPVWPLIQITAAVDILDAVSYPRAYHNGPFSKNKIAEIMEHEFRGELRYRQHLIQRIISTQTDPA